MNIVTINPKPTEEVISFANEKGATTVVVDSYTTTYGVIWAVYNDDHICLGKCDATGAEER